MFRCLASLALLAVSSTALCDGLSIDGLILGGCIDTPSLASRVTALRNDGPDDKIWTANIPATYLGTSVSASIVVNGDRRIHNIELHLPLERLDEVKRDITHALGEPKSDTTSFLKKGLAVWDRRDKETAVGLFSKPEAGDLLLNLIWTIPDQNHG